MRRSATSPTMLRAQQRDRERHRKNLREMRPTMKIEAPAEHSHLRNNPKKILARRAQDERTAHENAILIGKMYAHLSRSNQHVEDGFGGHEAHLHEVARRRRRTQQRRLDAENTALMQRIKSMDSEYSPHQLGQEWEIIERARSMQRHPSAWGISATGRVGNEELSPGRLSTRQQLASIPRAKVGPKAEPKARGRASAVDPRRADRREPAAAPAARRISHASSGSSDALEP